jgi:protein tyrosine phosphatase
VLNFAGLANFSSDRSRLDEEFIQIPSINVKPDELPPDAETKNRYANVIPIPETRVPLKVKPGSVVLDQYINANYVKVTSYNF